MARKRSCDNIVNVLPENLHKASLSQLARLPREVLQLHLAARYVKANGSVKKLAQILFNVIRKRPLGLHTRCKSNSSQPPPVSETKKKRKRNRKSCRQDVLLKEVPETPNADICTTTHTNKRSNPVTIHTLSVPKQNVVLKHAHQTKRRVVKPSSPPNSQINQPESCNQSPAPSWSASLPPLMIPADIRDSIVKGEFIDFTQLLSRTVIAKQTASPMTSLPLKITSFTDWMEAWNNYLSVIVAHTPSRALEMIGYQRIITSASSQVPLSKWLMYDTQFRMLASLNRDLRWDTRHQDLWLQCLVTRQYKEECNEEDSCDEEDTVFVF